MGGRRHGTRSSASRGIAALAPPPWEPRADSVVAGCFVCFPRGGVGPGAAGDHAWAAAVAIRSGAVLGHAVIEGSTDAAYESGLLALREGPLLERVVRALRPRPDVVLVDATARDHPRGAGLTLQLGALLDVPTVGVTHRPLVAVGDWPSDDHAGAWSLVWMGDEPVAMWLRTRRHVRPLVVHPGWRTNPSGAARRRARRDGASAYPRAAPPSAAPRTDGTSGHDLTPVRLDAASPPKPSQPSHGNVRSGQTTGKL